MATVDMNRVIGRANLLFVTFDSLRFDVAALALDAGKTPEIGRWIGAGGWEKRESPGTFTLASHSAFFHGFLPTSAERPGAPRILALAYQGARTIDENTFVFEDAPDIIRGCAGLGYKTICVGGVGFFSKRNPLGEVLPGYFEESVWTEEMGVTAPGSTAAQVDWAVRRLARLEADRQVLLFVNISATHVPHHHYCGAAVDCAASQTAALAYVDSQLGPLMAAMTARGPLFGLFCADHGEAYGEDGRYGHRIAHPSVTTVPYAQFQAGLLA